MYLPVSPVWKLHQPSHWSLLPKHQQSRLLPSSPLQVPPVCFHPRQLSHLLVQLSPTHLSSLVVSTPGFLSLAAPRTPTLNATVHLRTSQLLSSVVSRLMVPLPPRFHLLLRTSRESVPTTFRATQPLSLPLLRQPSQLTQPVLLLLLQLFRQLVHPQLFLS